MERLPPILRRLPVLIDVRRAQIDRSSPGDRTDLALLDDDKDAPADLGVLGAESPPLGVDVAPAGEADGRATSPPGVVRR